jgi:hypothetical protein
MIEFRVPSLPEISILLEVTRGTRGELTRAETTRFGQAKVSTRFVVHQFFRLKRLPHGSEQESRACLRTPLASADHQVRFGFEKSWFHNSVQSGKSEVLKTLSSTPFTKTISRGPTQSHH